VKLSIPRVAGYRAFVNKIWNATRFALMSLGDAEPRPLAETKDDLSLADRWILSRLQAAAGRVAAGIEGYRFDEAANGIYQFFWNEFCDWYIELAKPGLNADEASRRAEVTRSVLLTVLSGMLRMLHPMMPFVTEELWEKLPGCSGFLAVAAWPTQDDYQTDLAAEEQMRVLQQTVVAIRHLRAESRIDAGKRIPVLLHTADADVSALLTQQQDLIATLVRAESISMLDTISDDQVAARGMAAGVQIALPLEGLLDFDAERGRIGKELDKVEKELITRSKKLANHSFTQRAPAEVVEKERALRDDLVLRKERLAKNLANLGST